MGIVWIAAILAASYAGLRLLHSAPEGRAGRKAEKVEREREIRETFKDYEPIELDDLNPTERSVVRAAAQYLAREQGVTPQASDQSRKSIQRLPGMNKWNVNFRFDFTVDKDDPHTTFYVVEVSKDLSCMLKGFLEY